MMVILKDREGDSLPKNKQMCTVLAIKKNINYKIIITILHVEIHHTDQVVRIMPIFQKGSMSIWFNIRA